MLNLSPEAEAQLRKWLELRESCIGDEMEDFGELKQVFKEIFGRDPETFLL